MATGTGKTRIAIALVDVLMRAAHIERILFLVDRIALREQGLAAFKESLPNEPRWPKVGEKLIVKDRRIYVATYPTMLNIIRGDSNRLSPHFFDLVVIDESRRSIYNTYGEILDYFKAINLGFAKPVYSYTKFWQMIGRGTRLLETAKIKPWCTEKEVFLILDCWDNFEYFKLQPKGKLLKPQLPLPVRLVGIRLVFRLRLNKEQNILLKKQNEHSARYYI